MANRTRLKRLKSLLHLDCLPATTDKGAKSWIWAHLILAIAISEHSQDFLEATSLDMLDLRFAPSLWRAQKFVIRILLIAILGNVVMDAFLNAGPRFHRLLAEPPRKRKKTSAISPPSPKLAPMGAGALAAAGPLEKGNPRRGEPHPSP